MIYKGYITETDGTYAKVVSLQDEIFDDVLLLYPYGFQSKVKPSESTLVLIFCALGSKTNAFAIPYDILTQSTLEAGEAEMLALAPKAPFIGYGGQFEGYEMQWKTANGKHYARYRLRGAAHA